MKDSIKPLVLLLMLFARTATAGPPGVTLIEAKKIWDQAPHCAFTDLAYWKDQFVCAFREGRSHMSTDGKIRVLTSGDGDDWKPAALVKLADFDLRDAGLSILPDGRLMLLGGAAPRKEDGKSAPTGTFVSFSEDGSTWTEPKIVVPPGRWLWRVTWHDGKAYGVAYAASAGHPFTSLMVSDNGTEFRELVPKLLGDGFPTEASLRFASDGTAYCLQRRDGKPDANSAQLGISKSPYTDWQWHDLKTFFGGPNFVQIPPGQWIAAGRMHRDSGAKTTLALLDAEQKSLTSLLELPSGGDTSYPGLVWRTGILYVSYYSSHEGKTSIYLAKVEIKEGE